MRIVRGCLPVQPWRGSATEVTLKELAVIQMKEGRILDYEYEPKVEVNRACSVATGERGKGDIKLCALTVDLDEVRRNFYKIKKRDYEDI